MEHASMSYSILRITAAAVLAFVLSGQGVFGQTAGRPPQPAGGVRQLSIDEAVRLALEQNLGIRIDRLAPQIEDVAISQARSLWAPTLTSTLSNNSQNQPPTNVFAGGQSRVTDSRFSTELGLSQTLPTGATYSLAWNSARATSTNFFNNFEPLLTSNVAFNVTQPLLRNLKVDNVRQQLATSRKDREAADVQLRSTIALTTRNVKNAYWDLVYQLDNLKAQQQSLDLSKRLLADNEKRVQIGTMAPIDIVEAQSEVARNEETVIVAEAGIKQAEDRLRTLIFDPSAPDFWTMTLEPTETMSFQPQGVDVDGAIRRALANRTDVQLAKNSLERSDISIRYFRNQVLPEVNAQATYTSVAVGGTVLSPLTSFPVTGAVSRSILTERGFSSVLGDVFSSAFPTWTVGVSVSYPIGTSTAQTNLARAKLQFAQAEVQLRNLELQVTAQVRDAGRQVQTNRKRVDSARAARELAERRLEAEEKKFAAGIQISFFVFQAQRDLAQARTNEIRALADYNKSLVDIEAVQDTTLTGSVPLTSAAAGAMPTFTGTAPVTSQSNGFTVR
jgi:outer membrane protein TolC